MSFTETVPCRTRSKSIIILNSPEKQKERTAPTKETVTSAPTSEILRWTFRQESIASCFVKDIFDLQDDPKGDFYWLRRVPCRVVRIVGLIVGVVQHDDNTRYSVDDGSGIIDCLQRHDKTPPTAKKLEKSAKPTFGKSEDPRPYPPPIADVGAVLRVEGRVARARGSKVLRVERGGITICQSANEEPRHWAEVVRLHKEYYSLREPFVVPLPKEPSTPQRPSRSQLMSSPVTSHMASSPVKGLSSPAKPPSDGLTAQPSSPPRLRHPSKLRSRDLTEATFRIYVKHYIDNAPDLQHISTLPMLRGSIAESSQGRIQHSFTVGYLRRVPLLANMARSVVRAERKRREREARKRQETQSQSQRASHSTASRSSHPPTPSSESTSRKMKRLFIQTIRNLYAEGSIVIWEGPKSVLHTREEVTQHSFMWKNDITTMSNISTQNTVATSASQGYDSSAELSDEDPNEEAYMPVFQSYVAELVLDAMRKLSTRSRNSRGGLAGAELRTNCQPPTTLDIMSYLRKTDERWANLGEWAIKESLEHLEEDEFVFKAGKGRWALCL